MLCFGMFTHCVFPIMMLLYTKHAIWTLFRAYLVQWLKQRRAHLLRAQQWIPVSKYGVLVDMIHVSDWAFEAAGQEMRGMGQDAAYQPGLYLTATQMCDRFINRRMAQKFYDKALTIGLKGYAQWHQTVISRLADWEGIEKSRSVRDFDNYATRVLGKYETVDAYYRHNSSTNFVGNVMVPLLCISALDDPVCTREAIPWDECRANKNIVLATTHHGGHLAFYEGIAAKSLWWVRAVHEFFSILHSSSLIHRKKEAEMQIPPQESSIDQGPYVNITEDGMVTALGNEKTGVEDVHDVPTIQSEVVKDATPEGTRLADAPPQPPGQDINDVVIPVRRYMDQLSRHSRKSIWLLAYIAIITTWPLVGSVLTLFLKKKFAKLLPAVLRRR